MNKILGPSSVKESTNFHNIERIRIVTSVLHKHKNRTGIAEKF